MLIASIYLISFLSAIGCVTLFKLSQLIDPPTRRSLLSFLRKKLIYTLVLQRRTGTSGVNILAFLSILLFLTGNIVVCTYRVDNQNELAKRCGLLFLVNAIPLYLGGRTNLLMDQIFRVPLSDYYLFHRWVGRICVIEGLIHGLVSVRASKPSVLESIMLSLLAGLALLSLLFLRRHSYEVFLKSHLVLALALVGSLWFHIQHASVQAIICLGIASALWLVQHIAWAMRLIYRNLFGSSASTGVVFNVFPATHGSVQVMTATITLRKPWKPRPGQYIYITLPGIARHRAGFVQAHPYMVAWEEGSDITILLQRCRGFSHTLFSSTVTKSLLIVDGPYGQSHTFDDYDKVLCIASGIGITAHLLTIKHLLTAHNKKVSRVRRVSLLWFLETEDQCQWANRYLDELRQLDIWQIFTLTLYLPLDSFSATGKVAERTFHASKVLNIGQFIDKEASAEAGNMGLSMCVTPYFEQLIRKGVDRSRNDIFLFTTPFQPNETRDSRNAQNRIELSSNEEEEQK